MAMAYTLFPTLMGILSSEPLNLETELFYGLEEFHDDGWQAAMHLPNEWPEAWLPGATRLFKEDGVQPELWDGLMTQTREWSRQGVHVFAFRPPTSAAMIAIEDDLGEFDVRRFAEEFEEHGGRWIEIDASGYRSYDNSHLPRSEAIRLSEKIGRRIAESLGAPASTGPAVP
jgi:hypothetical protein